MNSSAKSATKTRTTLDHGSASTIVAESLAFAVNVDFNNHTDAAIKATIANFTPKMSRKLWHTTGPFTRSAVTDFAPMHEREAQLAMSATARLVAWSHETGGLKLDRDVIFSGNNIESYIAHGIENHSKYAATTVRGQLMRVARELGIVDMGLVPSRRTNRPRVQQPYSSPEMARFRAMANYQTTELRRYRWSLYLVLSAGCGLTAPEILSVKRHDVRVTDSGIVVRVNDRETVCHAAYENDLAALLESRFCGKHLFPLPLESKRSDPTTVIDAIRKMGGSEPTPDSRRMRATWIVWQLNNGTPVPTILNALALTRLRTLEGYLPYVSRADEATAHTQLRGEVVA